MGNVTQHRKPSKNNLFSHIYKKQERKKERQTENIKKRKKEKRKKGVN